MLPPKQCHKQLCYGTEPQNSLALLTAEREKPRGFPSQGKRHKQPCYGTEPQNLLALLTAERKSRGGSPQAASSVSFAPPTFIIVSIMKTYDWMTPENRSKYTDRTAGIPTVKNGMLMPILVVITPRAP